MTFVEIDKTEIDNINEMLKLKHRQIPYFETKDGKWVVNADLIGARGWEDANVYLKKQPKIQKTKEDLVQIEIP